MISLLIKVSPRVRSASIAAGIGVLALCPAVALGSATHASDSRWRLSASYYPSGAKTEVDTPSNANTQFLFGGLHSHTFKALHRLDKTGWLQVVQQKTTGKIGLDWAYGVSMYTSTAQAKQAAKDFKVPFKTLHGAGSYGGIAHGNAAGYYYTYSIFGSGATVIDQFCFSDVKERAQGKQKLDSYCTRQRGALAKLLAR